MLLSRFPSSRLLATLLVAGMGLLPVACRGDREPSAAEEAVAAASRGLDSASRERTLNRLEQLRTALSRYAIDHGGAYPEGFSLDGIGADLSPYLPLLLSVDAWGHTMTYTSDGSSYTIVSPGPDGREGTGDDITMRDGAIDGGP